MRITDACRAAMSNLARWDSVENCWEVMLPLPQTLVVPVRDMEFGDVHDLALEINEQMESAGIKYNNYVIDIVGGNVTFNSLSW